ncbi:MAG: hypothetical protein WCW25_04930 [Patescibacteria group bacterium]
MRSNARKETKITDEQLKYIYNNDWSFFTEKILSNCHCPCTGGGYDATFLITTFF